jgi:hypothetical protein
MEGAEIKWTKVTQAYKQKYIAFANEAFDLVDEGLIRYRIFFSQNRHKARLDDEQRDDEFYRLYYQFLKHSFGLQHIISPPRANITLIMDALPENKAKNRRFKAFISGLSNQFDTIKVAPENIADVDSKKHNILQSVDLILGAMQSKLNDKHTRPVHPNTRRSKRALAKSEVYDTISQRIFKIHPRFNVGISTGRPNGSSDSWKQPYRHWLFVPHNREPNVDYVPKRRR